MRAALLALLLTASLGAPAIAETEADVPPPPEAPAPVTVSRAEKLDQLFATLKTATDKDAAKEAENAIVRLWLESGSDTVDLLMSWTLKAMEDKDYPLALDFLDRITMMKPDYAEGWNKRATVYYLVEDYSKSIADIARTLAIEPRHFGALSGLGTLMRGIGDNKRAMEAYRQALAFDPHLDNVKKALEELEEETGGEEL